jgi:GNAT superfamily N-acetyltransferase
MYSYEIQVSKDYRRHGLGRVLMQKLADIGTAWGMQKIMLTVFKGILRYIVKDVRAENIESKCQRFELL